MVYSNIEDLRQAARRRLPRMFFDYLDGGAFGEHTLSWNKTDFDDWWLEQEIMVDISRRRLASRFLGADHELPLMLGPVGFAGMFWPRGERCAAQAAEAAGIPMCLSTFSIDSLEQVAPALPNRLALQLYVFRDRRLAEEMIDRALASGVHTLFLTADTDVSSIRERDTRNGFRTASHLNLRALLDMASRPGWCLRMASAGIPQLGNVKNHPDLPSNLMSQAAYLSGNVDPSMSWKDLQWLRDRWPGKLVLKGVLSTRDADRALAAKVDAIVVSNHGGRQLDGARSSISALPEIAEFVNGRTEILFDSGIRRGSQIVKALALGADAVMLGRAYAYGLAAKGRAGVAEAITLLETEMEITLALMGVTSIDQLKENRRSLIHRRQPACR